MTALHRGHPAARPRRRRRRVVQGLAALALALVAMAVLMAARAEGPATNPVHVPAIVRAPKPPPVRPPARSSYGIAGAPARDRVAVKLMLGLSSGLLFDVSSGRALWARNPSRVVPMASLTKMMTALVVVEHATPEAQVPVTNDALNYTGSGIGLLPRGRRVPLTALLYGLLLPSGNDAAIALADYVAGTQSRFVALMNQRARELGLSCTHFSNVSGIVDQDNYSCAQDLALMAHKLLDQPLLATIVGSRSAILPFPIKGGKLYLYTNNPLLLLRYPGADGVKTGFTDAAGQCLVATARRGKRWLGVVLLHSGDPSTQAQQLLTVGFAKLTAG